MRLRVPAYAVPIAIGSSQHKSTPLLRRQESRPKQKKSISAFQET